MTTVLGIDPGKSGAAVCYYPCGGLSIARRQRLTPIEWVRELVSMIEYAELIVIEKVGPSPQMGRTSAFSFGHEAGIIHGACYAMHTPIVEVTPQKWQPAVGVHPKKGEPQPAHKLRLKQRAQELFPREKITADLADALLIAHYAMTIELPKHRGKAV